MHSHQYRWLDHEGEEDAGDPRDFQLGAPVSARRPSGRDSYKAFPLLVDDAETNQESFFVDHVESDDVESDQVYSGLGSSVYRTPSSSLELAEEGMFAAALKMRRRLRGEIAKVATNRRGLLAGGLLAAAMLLVGLAWTFSPWGPSLGISQNRLVNLLDAGPAEPKYSTPVFAVEAVHASKDKYWLTGGHGVGTMYLGSGVPMLWTIYEHGGLYVFESARYPTRFLSYDANGTVSFAKYGAVASAPKFKLKTWKGGLLGEYLIMTATPTARGSYLSHDGAGSVELFSAQYTDTGADQLWRIPNFPTSQEQCLKSTTANNNVFKCSDTRLCTGEACCSKSGQTTIQCPPNLPVLCFGIHCNKQLDGKDRCCASSEAACRARAGGKAECQVQANCTGFVCAAGKSLKPIPEKIKCAGHVCTDVDTPTCCKVDTVDPLSPVLSKSVFIDKTSSVQRGGFIYPRVEARLHDGDQVQMESQSSGRFLKVTEQAITEARGRLFLTSQSGMACQDGGDAVTCSSTSSSFHNMFEVEDAPYSGKWQLTGSVSLKSTRSTNYCRDTGVGVVCDSPKASGGATFDFEDAGDRRLCIKSARDNMYCRVHDQLDYTRRGKVRLKILSSSGFGNTSQYRYCSDEPAGISCEVARAANGTIFDVRSNNGYDSITILSPASKYCSADEKYGVRCNRGTAGKGEDFQLVHDDASNSIILKSYLKGKFCAVRTASIVTLRGNISLRASNGGLCVDHGPGRPMVCDVVDFTEKLLSREDFEIVNFAGPEYVSIRGKSAGLYCGYTEVGITCNKSTPSSSEVFRMVDAGGSQFALKNNQTGRFCSIGKQPIYTMRGPSIAIKSARSGLFCTDRMLEGRQPEAIACDSTEVDNASDWNFSIVDSGTGFDQISLIGGKAKRYCIDDPKGVVCQQDPASPSETGLPTFTLVDALDGRFALQGTRLSKYCAVKAQPLLTMEGLVSFTASANSSWMIRDEEVVLSYFASDFELVDAPNSPDGTQKHIVSTATRKFCSDTHIGLSCTASEASDLETFTIVDAGDDKVGFMGNRLGKYCGVASENVLTVRGEFKVKSIFGKICNPSVSVVECQIARFSNPFVIKDAPSGKNFVTLSTNTGAYCSDQPEGMRCNVHTNASVLETFEMSDVGFGRFALKGSRSGKFCGVRQDTVKDVEGGFPILNGGTGHLCRFHKSKIYCDTRPQDVISDEEKLFLSKSSVQSGATILAIKAGECAEQLLQHLGTLYNLGVTCLPGSNAPGFIFNRVDEDRYSMQSSASGRYCGTVKQTYAHMRGPDIIFKSARTQQECSYQWGVLRCSTSASAHMWNKLTVEDLGANNAVALRAGSDHWYCNDSPQGITCDGSSPTSNSEFLLFDRDDGRFVIKGRVSGKFCGVEDLPIETLAGKGIQLVSSHTGRPCEDHASLGGAQAGMECNVSIGGAHSIFEIQDVGSGLVSIKSAAGKYCSDTEIGLVCTSDIAGASESFKIVDGGDDLFALKGGRTGKYCVMFEQSINMVQGSAITLKASDAGYCSDQPGRIQCEKESFGAWEIFEIQQTDPINNLATIQGGHQSKFCSDQPTGVSCFSDAPGKWEIFAVEYVSNESVALKGGRSGKYCGIKEEPILRIRGKNISFESALNGKFCSDLSNGVFCRSDAAQSWETYDVNEVGLAVISLKGGKQGKYCSDEEIGLICNSTDHAGGKSAFTVVDANDGSFALQGGRAGKYCAIQDESVSHLHGDRITLKRSKTGKYCTDYYGKLRCTHSKATDRDLFTVTNNGFGEVTLKGRQVGKFCSEESQGLRIGCASDHPEDWDPNFTVIDAGGNKIKLFGGGAQGYCAMKPQPVTDVRGSIKLRSKVTGKLCKMGVGTMTCKGHKAESAVSVYTIPNSTQIRLMSADTDEYCADTEKGLDCTSDTTDAWQAFTLEDVGGKVALKGGRSGKYCGAKNQSIAQMLGVISMVSVSTGNKCMDQSDGISCIIDSPPPATTFFNLEKPFDEEQGDFVTLRDRNGKYCTDEPSGILCQADDDVKSAFFKISPEAEGSFSLIGNRLGKKCGVSGDRIICNVDDEATGVNVFGAPAHARFKQEGWTPDIQVACDQDALTDKAIFEIDGWVPDERLICDNSTTAELAEVFEQGGWSPMQQIICNSDNLTEAAKFKPQGWSPDSILQCEYDESEKGVFQVGGWTAPWNIKCDADAPPGSHSEYRFAQTGWNRDSRIVCNRDERDAAYSLASRFEGVNWAPGNVIVCDANSPIGANFLYSFQGWRKDAPVVCDFDSLKDSRTHFEPVGWRPVQVVACTLDEVQGFEVNGWQPEERLICDSDNLTEAAKFLPVGWDIETRIFCDSDSIDNAALFNPVGPIDVLLKQRIVCDAFHNASNLLSIEFDDSLSPTEKRLMCDRSSCSSSEAKFSPSGWSPGNSLGQTQHHSEASTFSVVRSKSEYSDVAFLCLDIVPVRYLQAVNIYELICNSTTPYYFHYERVSGWSSEDAGYLKLLQDEEWHKMKYLTFDDGGKKVTFEADRAGDHETMKIHLLGGYETVRPLVRGVNLGNWLLLERWMAEDLFLNTMGQKYEDACTAIDEYGLMKALERKGALGTAKDRMEAHWSTWITEADIAWIQDHGLNAVRIPFGYWIVKPEAPFVEGGFKYLKKVVKWCEDHKVGFLMDFHGLKGSQQGSITSGNCGACGVKEKWCGETWIKFLEYQAYNLEVIKIVTKHFAKSPMFLGLEVANEVSDSVNATECMAFYQKAYDIIRSINPTAPVYFDKTFNPSKYAWPNFYEVFIDDHVYYKSLFTGTSTDSVQKLELARKRLLSSPNMPVLVGEWGLADGDFSSPGYFVPSNDTLVDYARYRLLAKMQLQAYEQYSTGWYFWTYKTQYRGSTWNYVDMCADGLIPGCKGSDFNFTAQPWWKTPSCAFAYLDGACDKIQNLQTPYVAGNWVESIGSSTTGKLRHLSQVGITLYSEVGTTNVSGTISRDDSKISMFGLTGSLEGKIIKWSNGEHWAKTT